MLLGRSLEINYLKENYEKSGSSLLVVYGQKNVGKTVLLKSFCEKIPYHYYLARPCSERQQSYFWANQVRKANAELEVFPTFYTILETLTKDEEQKKVIIIDEFQSFIKVNNTFMRELLEFLNNTTKEVMIVLSSSQVGFVENSLITKIGSAAYGIQGFLKIRELDFQSLTEYFPQMSTKEAVSIYSVFGSMPGNFVYLSDDMSVKENICKTLLQRHSAILTDTLSSIEEQLRETNVYYTILAAMAEGKEKLNELYAHTEFSRAKISVYLKNLMELEIVEKVFSLDTKGRDNTKKGIYRIKNKVLSFYFRFVYPNLSQLQFMTPEFFYEEFIEAKLDNYIMEHFSVVCKEYLELMNRKGNLPITVTGFGEWVGKVGTIPVIALGEEGRSISCLCHWGRNAMPYADYEWFLFCMEQAKLESEFIYIFSISGFDEKMNKEAMEKNNLILIDMY